MTDPSTHIMIETQLGMVAGKIIEEKEDKYIIEFGGGKKWEVLKEEVMEDGSGVKTVVWW